MIKIFTDGSALLARRDTSDRGTPRLHFLPWIFALRGGKSAPVRVSCTNPTRHARQAELALRLPENASSRYLTDAAFAQICVKRTAARPSAADAFLRALEADVQKLAPLLDTMVPINPPHGDTIAFGCPPWRIPKTPYPGVWPWFLPHLDAAPESVEAVQEWAEAAATWLLGQSPAVSSAKLTVRARLPEDAGSGLPVDLELRRAPGLRDTLRPDALGLAPPSLPAGAPIPTGVQRNGGNGGAGLDRPVIATTSVDRATADLSGHTRLRLQMRFGPMPDRVCAALESEEPLAG
jgi:hypothetical protein